VDGSRDGQLGLLSPSFGQPCGVVPCLCSLSGDIALGLRLPSHARTSTKPSPYGSASRSPLPINSVCISCFPFRGSTSGGSSCICRPLTTTFATRHRLLHRSPPASQVPTEAQPRKSSLPDGFEAPFTVHLDLASEKDIKLTESWKGDADGMPVLAFRRSLSHLPYFCV
jgi:hypothetical protein